MEHGLPPRAVEIASLFGFPITNSMLVTWIVAIGLIVFVQMATRTMRQVPEGMQNFLEWLVESLYAFSKASSGRTWSSERSGFFASIFIFILAANWVSLIRESDRSAGDGRRRPASSCKSRFSAAPMPM